jgi:hypothetical protein
VAAGLLVGLGLEVHIDVLVTGLACGLVYLLRWPRLAVLFAAGAATGVAVYAALNILPDPASYYVTTVLVRADATATYAGAAHGIVGSFLDPRLLLAKEALRYRQLWTLTAPLELLLLAAAYAAMWMRQNGGDAIVIPLTAGAIVAAAVILNNASPLYYIHVLPALVVPVGPLFTHAMHRDGAIDLARMPTRAFAVAAALTWILCASAGVRTMKTIRALHAAPATSAALIAQVRAAVDRRCRVAGDGTLYVPYFADYPYFVSLQPTEVKHGLLFYRELDEDAYWEVKLPDAVFSADPLRAPLVAYVARHGFAARGDGVWVNPAGCR